MLEELVIRKLIHLTFLMDCFYILADVTTLNFNLLFEYKFK